MPGRIANISLRTAAMAVLLSVGVIARASGSMLSEEAHCYLLTCSPGKALYLHYGHTALLFQDQKNEIDEVYNYGLFDFMTDHFYWRFVRGETYYQLGKQSTASFVRSSHYDGREISVQELNLQAPEREALYRALVINNYPENRTYLYNFVFDNCATRPYHRLKDALGTDSLRQFTSSFEGAEGMTYRQFISHYTPKGSWADLGINCVFGPAADRSIHGEERLFLPEELMFYLSAATFADGSPVVSQEAIEPFTIVQPRWYETWYFGIALLFAAMVALSYYDRRRGRRSRWADAILISIEVVLLVIVTFLTFFSVHPLVGYGPYLLLLPSVHLCSRVVYWWH